MFCPCLALCPYHSNGLFDGEAYGINGTTNLNGPAAWAGGRVCAHFQRFEPLARIILDGS